jgi:thioredoxin-related protein
VISDHHGSHILCSSRFMRVRLLMAVTLVLSLGAGSAPVFAGTWQSIPGEVLADLRPALTQAEAEGKDLLVNFTGSDWCLWCKRLDQEVFSQPAFRQYVQQHFVLVSLDFPREGGAAARAQSVDLARRNRAEATQFSIEGFPTVLLMLSNGAGYERTGFVTGGAANYVAHLEALRTGEARRQTLARVSALRNPTSSEAQLEASVELWGHVATNLKAELEAVLRRHDPEDSHGLLAPLDLERFLDEQFATKEVDFPALLAGLDGLARAHPGVVALPMFHLVRGQVAMDVGRLNLAQESLDTLRGPGFQVAELEPLVEGLARRVTAGLSGDAQVSPTEAGK